MLETKVYDLVCTNIDGELELVARLDFTIEQAVQFVKNLSIELESSEFDLLMQQYFNTICSS